MKKFKQYIVGALLLPLLLGSCTDNFEEYNTDPNRPTSLDAAALIPNLIDCLASPEENPCQRNNTFWACFGGYVTATNSWGRQFLYATYNIDDDWNKWSADWYFNTLYRNYFQIARLTNETGPVFSLAQMLRVNIMQYVVNMQGPLPYSQVKMGTFAVPYDDEQTAYMAMFADLDQAIAGLKTAQSILDEDNTVKPYDRVYGGDYSKWLKYANTLKLRMAIRIARVSGQEEFAHQKAREAVQDGVMTSASDTAWDNLDAWKNGFFTVQNWGEMRANASIVTFMNGYEDPRRSVYFKTINDGAGTTYNGVRSGISGIQTSDYASASKFNVEVKTPMLIFSAAEAAFLQAEAALLGWTDVCPSARSFYEAGIAISFADRGISSNASSYYNDSSRLPGSFTDMKNSACNYTPKNQVSIMWNESASDAEKLNRVITQKWIANFPLGAEAWNDYRRTGYPDIFPAHDNRSTQGVTKDRGQRRLRFSLNEYETNRANVQAAAAMIGGDRENIDLWWAKKN